MHLEGLDHYVPPKARYPYEIGRRQSLPRGVLLSEYQSRGLAVAVTILRHIEQPEDLTFASDVLAASSINSSWYGLARRAPVMRRRLKLPILAQTDRDYAPTAVDLVHGAIGELTNAGGFADRYTAALTECSNEVQKHARSLGRIIGNASLTIACVGMSEPTLHRLSGLPDDLVQQAVRRRGLIALHQAHMLGETIGTPPSLAQLADPNSDVSVYWRRQAPTGALEAFELATQTHRAA